LDDDGRQKYNILIQKYFYSSQEKNDLSTVSFGLSSGSDLHSAMEAMILAITLAKRKCNCVRHILYQVMNLRQR
jgi:cardiolipin synthase